jgi:hypothetical protein
MFLENEKYLSFRSKIVRYNKTVIRIIFRMNFIFRDSVRNYHFQAVC